MPTQLQAIRLVEATLHIKTGLHIGAGADSIQIGGIDNLVARHAITGAPFIAGSSLKGKMRSLLEWRHGLPRWSDTKPMSPGKLPVVEAEGTPGQQAGARQVLQFFGYAPSGRPDADDANARDLGPSRFAFWDCDLTDAWRTDDKRALWFEVKSENSINRISGVADAPRFFQRVPAGVEFRFRLSLRVLDGDDEQGMLRTLWQGLRLVELDGLGGQISRGYGRVAFRDICVDGQQVLTSLDEIEAFGA